MAVDAWDCRSSSSAAVQPNASSSRVPPLAISQGSPSIFLQHLLS